MTTRFKIHETLENAFIAGLLLTGSVERAEAAILESVRISCPDDLFSEALFRRTVHYLIEPQNDSPAEQQKELDRAASILPFELRCVLRLSQNLRHCYVLRILVGLPREVCAWLLHLNTSQVEERTRAAMLELPRIQQKVEHHSGAKKAVDRTATHSNLRRLPRGRKPLGSRAPVTFFTTTKIIQFDKQVGNT